MSTAFQLVIKLATMHFAVFVDSEGAGGAAAGEARVPLMNNLSVYF